MIGKIVVDGIFWIIVQLDKIKRRVKKIGKKRNRWNVFNYMYISEERIEYQADGKQILVLKATGRKTEKEATVYFICIAKEDGSMIVSSTFREIGEGPFAVIGPPGKYEVFIVSIKRQVHLSRVLECGLCDLNHPSKGGISLYRFP